MNFAYFASRLRLPVGAMAEYAHHSDVDPEWEKIQATFPPEEKFDDVQKEIDASRKDSLEVWAPGNQAIWEHQIPDGAVCTCKT
jgi:hypothetical protein